MTAAAYSPNPLLAWREIEGQVVIISPQDGQMYELNEAASFLWKRANGSRTALELAALLAAEYDVAPETAQTDTVELLDQLERQGLLCRRISSGAVDHA